MGMKLALFSVVLVVVLFPNPILLMKQLKAYLHVDTLIQTTFPGMERIHQELDAQIPAQATRQQEFQTIQRYVYTQIPYAYDWDNWGNTDFWPTAAEVWQRKKEDCDGRAILAASILRARGFTSARLVGNVRHIWVAVDEQELMGPDREQTLVRENDKLRVNLPSWELLIGSIALYFAEFPAIRNLILLLTLLGLCYHPCAARAQFLGITTIGLVGFILLQDWGRQVMESRSPLINFNFIGGGVLLCGAVILSLFIEKLGKHPTSELFEASEIYVKH